MIIPIDEDALELAKKIAVTLPLSEDEISRRIDRLALDTCDAND